MPEIVQEMNDQEPFVGRCLHALYQSLVMDWTEALVRICLDQERWFIRYPP